MFLSVALLVSCTGSLIGLLRGKVVYQRGRCVFLFLLGLMAAGSASARESGDNGGDADSVPLVLTPARLEQPQSEVPASVTVIDRQLIEATGAREIHEVLRLVPGMSVAKADWNIPSVAYHGTHARDIRRMLVQLDGRSLYMPGLARVLWNDIPVAVEDIERIEVTRGPNAASYGANAFSGIINIITRHPRDVSGTRTTVRRGNNGIEDWQFSHAGQSDRGALRFTAERRHDDGYDGDRDERYGDHPQPDEKVIETFNVRASLDKGPRDSLEMLFGGKRGTMELPKEKSYQEFASYQNQPGEKSDRAFLQFRWQRQVSPDHAFKVQTYVQQSESNQYSDLCMNPFPARAPAVGGIFFSRELREVYEQTGRDLGATQTILEHSIYGGPQSDPDLSDRANTLNSSGAGLFCTQVVLDVREQRYDVELQDTLYFGDKVKLVTGINWRHDRAQSDTFLGGTDENYSQRVFGTLEVQPVEPLLFNLGGFWEKDQLNGEFFSPRAAFIIKPTPGHSLRMVYSESLRTMDIYENRARVNLRARDLSGDYATDTTGLLGWNTPLFFITQNSDGTLDPERIRSRELGYFGRFRTLELDVRLFEEELRDLLSESLSPFDFQPANKDRVDLKGWETQIAWRPHPDHLLRLTGARIDNEATINTEGRFSPEHSGSALWRYHVSDGWQFSTAWYLAQDYNKWEYERADLWVSHRRPLSGVRLRLDGKIQHYMNRNPIIYEENRYEDQTHYWLSASLEF